MTATREDISRWYDDAVAKKAAFLIVAVDTWDYENYPIYCMSAQECRLQYASHNGPNMQRVDEVYDLSMDRASQMAERRAVHLPSESAP